MSKKVRPRLNSNPAKWYGKGSTGAGKAAGRGGATPRTKFGSAGAVPGAPSLAPAPSSGKSKAEEGALTQALVGILEARGADGIVRLDKADSYYGRELLVLRQHLNGAPFGMKVVAEPLSEHATYAKIVEVLGDPARPDVAMQSIIRHYGLSESFPAAVLAEVSGLAFDPSPDFIQEEIALGRRDLRHGHSFTIDGEDAKDLDDAIEIEPLPAQGLRLWVHIADVTAYVKAGTALDQEAQQRGNSVYLADRVLPMLPPQLSNGLCSLNPDKDRLTLSCRLDFDAAARVVDGEVVPAVICSKLRSTYTEVQALLDGQEEGRSLPEWFKADLLLMQELAQKLNEQRRQRGALNFNFPETKCKVEADGVVSAIALVQGSFANELIEAFMIAANEYVAEMADRAAFQIVYRVHEDPDPERIQSFVRLAKQYGCKPGRAEKISPLFLQQLLVSCVKSSFAPTLEQLLLRSLAKARYAPTDLGHFGLASTAYCHFTSPIRRYADLFTHRALKAYVDWQRQEEQKQAERKLRAEKLPAQRQVASKLAEQKQAGQAAVATKLAAHISLTERIAIAAERDSVAQKVAEYYLDKLGQEFGGKISGFSRYALYVQLDNGAEGSIAYKDIPGSRYYFDENYHILRSERGGRIFAIGDAVKVRLLRVDIVKRFVDFGLLEHTNADNVTRSYAVTEASTPNPVKAKVKLKAKTQSGQGKAKVQVKAQVTAKGAGKDAAKGAGKGKSAGKGKGRAKSNTQAKVLTTPRGKAKSGSRAKPQGKGRV